MAIIRITSNPFLKKFSIERDNFGTWTKFNQDAGLKSDYEGASLTNCLDDLLQKIEEKYGEIENIIVDGADVDYEDCKKSVERVLGHECQIGQNRRVLSGKEAFDEAERIEGEVHRALEDYLAKHPESEVKGQMDKLHLLSKPKINICFLGNYSGGKSTIINALIGDNILPTAKGALTYCIWEIERTLDGTVSFNGEALSGVEELKEKIKLLTKNDSKEEGKKYYLKLPFSKDSKLDKNIQYVFVDTPGSNNEKDKKHIESLTSYLENEVDSLPIIVCVANQLTSPDFATLIKMVNETGKGINFLRGIFIAHDWGGDDGLEQYKEDFNSTCQNSNISGISKKMLCVNPLYAMARRAGLESTLDKINSNYVRQYEQAQVVLPNYSLGCEESVNKGKEDEEYIYNTGMYSLENEINLYAQRYSYFFKTKEYIDCLKQVILAAKTAEEEDKKSKKKDIKDKIEEVAQSIVSQITEAKTKAGKISETQMAVEIEKEYKALKKEYKALKKEQKKGNKPSETQKEKARDLLVNATNNCYANKLSSVKTELQNKFPEIMENADKDLKDIIQNSTLCDEKKKELGQIISAASHVISLSVNEKEYIKRFLWVVRPDYSKAVKEASNAWLSTLERVEKECLGKFTNRYEKLLALSKGENERCVFSFETNQFIAELTEKIGVLNSAYDVLDRIMEFQEG